MNRRNAYLIIATSWALICPSAIAQDNSGKTATPSNKSVAAGTTSGIPIAPAMVLPKTNTTTPLKHSVQKKARGAYPSSHYQKAMYYKQRSDKSHALVEFLKATQENPRLVKAYYEQALIFRERNYLKLAQSSLDQALAIKPDYQEARMLLATIQIQQGNVGAAMKQLGQSLGINVGTGDGAKTDDDVPPPMVLQSVHMALPEGMTRNVMKVVKANPSDELNVAQEKSNERDSLAFGGIRIPNPLHMFWGGGKPEPAPEKPATKITIAKKSNLSNSDFVYVRKGEDSASDKDKAVKSEEQDKSKLSSLFGQSNQSTDSKEGYNQVDETPVGKPPTGSDFSDEAAASLDVNRLPTLPPEDSKSNSSDSKTPAKESRAERRARLAKESEEKARKEAEEKAQQAADAKVLKAQSNDDAAADSAPDEVRSNRKRDSEKSELSSEKNVKKAKRPWFARLIPSFEEDQNETPAPPPTSPVDRAVATAISAGSSAIKQGMATELPGGPVETFDKPDESRAMVEKVTSAAQAAATNLSNIAKNGFQFPNLPNINSNLFSGFGTSGGASSNDPSQSLTPEAPKPYKPQIAPNSDDPWSVRLRYLADHGTGTLKEGEAFMFSEESGEATLFLADGQTVRRTIYLPRDAQEVVKQRRPDIVNPDDLLYNLSLLAKLMPRASQQQQQASSNPPIQSIIGAPAAQQPQQAQAPASNFDAKDLMGKSQKFWGWLKGRLENLVPN